MKYWLSMVALNVFRRIILKIKIRFRTRVSSFWERKTFIKLVKANAEKFCFL